MNFQISIALNGLEHILPPDLVQLTFRNSSASNPLPVLTAQKTWIEELEE